MGKDVFSFKQFDIKQEISAMKVCTDSCIFGAYVAPKLKGKVLDIGCGTGLLSLMAAQYQNCEVLAVEIDIDSYNEALNNVNSSPWRSQIKVLHTDIRNISISAQYDYIICNPPFYNNHLNRKNARQNMAMHGTGLNYNSLCSSIEALLSDKGIAFILLPASQLDEFNRKLAKHSLYVNTICFIKNFINQEPFRAILSISRQSLKTITDNLTIYSKSNVYTSEIYELLKPYYLKL